MKIVSIPYQLT